MRDKPLNMWAETLVFMAIVPPSILFGMFGSVMMGFDSVVPSNTQYILVASFLSFMCVAGGSVPFLLMFMISGIGYVEYRRCITLVWLSAVVSAVLAAGPGLAMALAVEDIGFGFWFALLLSLTAGGVPSIVRSELLADLDQREHDAGTLETSLPKD